MDIAKFDSSSRLILFAPHPDDEALAYSVILQQAVRAGAAIRIVDVTDGDDAAEQRDYSKSLAIWALASCAAVAWHSSR